MADSRGDNNNNNSNDAASAAPAPAPVSGAAASTVSPSPPSQPQVTHSRPQMSTAYSQAAGAASSSSATTSTAAPSSVAASSSSSSSSRLPSLAALSAVSRRPNALKELKDRLPSLCPSSRRSNTAGSTTSTRSSATTKSPSITTTTASSTSTPLFGDESGVEFKGPQPSCQLFNMFKAMAAGAGAGRGSFDFDEDTDMDTDTEDGGPIAKRTSVATTTTNATTTTDNVSEPTSSALTPADSDAGDPATAHQLPTKPSAGDNNDEEILKRWLRDTMEHNQTVGSRFTAASMSSFSPYSEREMLDNSSSPRRPSTKSKASTTKPNDYPLTEEPEAEAEAEGHGVSSEDEWYPAADRDPGTEDSSVISNDSAAEIDNRRYTRDEIPEAQKLAVIVEEFGDIAGKMVNWDGSDGPPERILAESQGSMFKGVMMIGNLHLTTHRLTFHALLPPDEVFTKLADVLPAQTEEQAAARDARPDIIQAGPVTMHRHSIIKSKKKKRVWMELYPDMITTYPSADEAGRTRPLFSILLSTALRLSPLDPSHPRDFYLTYETADGERTTHFSVDNEQSAMNWRRQFESALFRYARERFREAHARHNQKAGLDGHDGSSWSLLRCCVPLDRATINGIGDFHSFATLMNLDVSLDHSTHVTWHPEDVAEGNFAGYGKYTEAGEMADDVKKDKKVKTPTHSGANTPRRSLSLRQALPSFKRVRDGEGRDRSPLVQHSAPPSVDEGSPDAAQKLQRLSLDLDQRPPPPPAHTATWIDSTLPPRLQVEHKRTFSSDSIAPMPGEDSTPMLAQFDIENKFQFLVAVLNEHAWFATALEGAMLEAKKRHYREGVTPAKMTLDVGGYDCLALDDDDTHDVTSSEPTTDDEHSERADDEDAHMPHMLIVARKAEKASMAARVFSLREDEGIWLKRCYVKHYPVPARGHIIVSPRFICFWRRARVGSDIKYRYSTRDVKGATVAPPLRLGWHGMALKIHGHHDQRFEFWNPKGRDETMARINALVAYERPATPQRQTTGDSTATAATTTTPTSDASSTAVDTSGGNSGLSTPSIQINPNVVKSGGDKSIMNAVDVLAPPMDMLMQPKALSEDAIAYLPFVANRPGLNSAGRIRLTPRRFTMLTIGSRGDVQPYIALGLRLMQDGHKVVIITHEEFKDWIEGYGIEHRQAGGDPTALMKLSTEHRMFSPAFFKDALGTFRQWLDDLLYDAWNAAQDADVLIESPSAMAGIHIAEALKIPYFRAFTMPWTRTAAYPQAFMVPAFEMGPSFNYSTYVLFDNIMWRASSGQINRWRKKYLGLGATDQTSLSVSKVPFLYNFSPAVVPKPLDWYDDITITGYWNLENSDMEWTPPDSMVAFMEQAKADGKPLVYIGFGSIVVPDPKAVTLSIIKGVEKADVRAIIAKGWSARDAKPGDLDIEFPPTTCYSVDKVPHGWLFPKIQAAMHHGGAGTTGASLRAGLPTLIKPWFGDQHFWAIRVTKLGVGHKVLSLKSDDIADALRKATTNTVMIEKATRIGERIRSENGVDAAVQAIHSNIVRAARDRQELKKEEAHRRKRTSTGGWGASTPLDEEIPSVMERSSTHNSTSSFSLPGLPKVTLPKLPVCEKGE